MKDRRHRINSGKPLLKLSTAVLVLAAMFCTAAQAQNVSEASHNDLGNGVTLDSVLIGTTTNQSDPVDFFVKLSGINGNSTSPNSRTIFVRGVPASSSTPPGMTAATTVLATYAVLAGAVTPNYASAVANANEVSVQFLQGNADQPIIVGSVYNGSESSLPSVSEIAVSKVADVAPASLFKNAVGSGGLVAQLNIANPLAPAIAPACNRVGTQLDVDANGNLLVRVFQSSGAPLPDVTVTIFVTSTAGTVQLQAMTDVTGLAAFNGPDNKVTLTSLSSVTSITLQFSGVGVVSLCVVQGNPNPSCDTSTDVSSQLGNVVLKSQVIRIDM